MGPLKQNVASILINTFVTAMGKSAKSENHTVTIEAEGRGIVSQTSGGELSGNSQGELPKNRIAAMKVSCRLVTAWRRSGGANPLRRRNFMYW